jgi:hypothetical protein
MWSVQSTVTAFVFQLYKEANNQVSAAPFTDEKTEAEGQMACSQPDLT